LETPYKEIADPSLWNDRKLKAEPMFKKSSKLTHDPIRVVPNILNVSASLMVERSESVLPKCTKSSTERLLPMRDIPYTLGADPKRMKDRTLRLLP
jgi:hypothetical protein